MDLVKYQLAVALKNFAASIPERGIDNVSDSLVTNIEYCGEDNLSATIKLIHNNSPRYFVFRLSERG